MTLLEILNSVLPDALPIETGVFSDTPPDTYAVLTPLSDTFEVHADNLPTAEVQEVRVSLFCKGNYTQLKNGIVKELLKAGLTITDRRYISHDDTTGHHNYCIDVAKEYDYDLEE